MAQKTSRKPRSRKPLALAAGFAAMVGAMPACSHDYAIMPRCDGCRWPDARPEPDAGSPDRTADHHAERAPGDAQRERGLDARRETSYPLMPPVDAK